ncbi:FHA domain-containing protein DDL-like [Anopheles stephensi]|uniref:FHA domain-containing protein DDL-like n=1 Tax=Anopheles stephensi TaxID=30069 RepID=UPI0007D384F7|nr:FHA domain-containing protein DDL-like [Anopheles stephensi]
MSSKVGTLRDSDSNDDNSDEDSSKERRDHRQSKEKRKKHKKHKKHKKSKKHKKERHSSESESHSKGDTRALVDSDDAVVPSFGKRTTTTAQASEASPAGHRYSKGSRHNGREMESHKQIPSRWDSSGEGEHSRQTLDSKRARGHRTDARGLNADGRVERDRSAHEQYKSARSSQSARSGDRSTHDCDAREKEHAAHQGNRNGNHHSRGYDKHGSNQRYRPDSTNRSIRDASDTRDNEVSSSSRDTGQQQRTHQRDTHGDRHKQSDTDKYGTGSRKRRHADSSSPYKQSMGRSDTTAPKRGDNGGAPVAVKEEPTSRTEEETDFKWGKHTDSKTNRFKADPDGDRTGESGSNAPDSTADSAEPTEKEKPNFGLSGKLTAETNTVHGVVIAYAEPPGARKPKRRWRLYPFKGEQALPTLYIHRQSCYLIGRDRKVCDIPVDHPSCSKQHAVLQYRLVPYERVDGTKSQCVRPYIIDLESSNGTFVNNKQIETKRYLELREKDVLKFGFSSREYVLLHENSKEDNEDDEGYDASPVPKRAASDPAKV